MPETPRQVKIAKEILHELELFLDTNPGEIENDFAITYWLQKYLKELLSDVENTAYDEGYAEGSEASWGDCDCACENCQKCTG